MANLRLENVTKHFDGKTVIDNVSLNIDDAEFIVVVGPSGCGKSTLLRMIAGLETVTEGNIYIKDKNVNKLEPRQRDVAMVFQNYALYPHMTVYQNIAYGLRMRGYKKIDIHKKVVHASRQLQISDYLYHTPNQLSGGQRQRVAMGRAIVRDPTLFLFDEPLSNLDTTLRTSMRVEIKKLQRMLNTTSIYVTHDQVEAMTLADRVVILNKGRVEQVGTPLEVYDKPATTFVASFVGSPSMNLIRLGIDKSKGGVFLDQVFIPLPQDKLSKIDNEVIIGIRPNDLMINVKTPLDLPKLPLTINYCEQLGSATHVFGQIKNVKQPVIAISKQCLLGEPNDVVEVFIRLENLHFFHPESNVRL